MFKVQTGLHARSSGVAPDSGKPQAVLWPPAFASVRIVPQTILPAVRPVGLTCLAILKKAMIEINSAQLNVLSAMKQVTRQSKPGINCIMTANIEILVCTLNTHREQMPLQGNKSLNMPPTGNFSKNTACKILVYLVILYSCGCYFVKLQELR